MNRSDVSHSLVVHLFVDDGALSKGIVSSPRSALELESSSSILIMTDKIMDAREVEASGERQGHWRPADQHRVGSDGKYEKEGG